MANNDVRINEVPAGLAVTGGKLETLGKNVTRKAADFVTSHAAGEWGLGTDTAGRRTPTHDEIAQLAFHLYETRGRQDGHDVQD